MVTLAAVGAGIILASLAAAVSPVGRRWLVWWVIIAIFFGGWRASQSFLDPGPPLEAVDQVVTLSGVVWELPERRDQSLRLVLKTDSGAKVLVWVDRQSSFKVGDRLMVKGRLEQPENFTTLAGREFDYRAFLGRQGIYYELAFAEATIAGQQSLPWWRRARAATRERLDVVIKDLWPEPASSLAGGLLVGARESLGTKILEQFRRAGLSHLVVLSGYNLTIIAEGLSRVLAFLPRTLGLSAGAIAMISFVVLTGGGASLIRALVMALLVLVARSTGRLYEAGRALGLAVGLMVLWEPSILLDDPGFQLSVAATAGLIWGSPLVARWCRWVPERFGWREIVATTVAAQISVAPLLVYHSGQLPVVGLLSNVLVLPTIPVVMATSALAVALGLVASWLGWLPAALALMGLRYELVVARLASQWPGAALLLPPVPGWSVIIWYSGYILIYVWLIRSSSRPGDWSASRSHAGVDASLEI